MNTKLIKRTVSIITMFSLCACGKWDNTSQLYNYADEIATMQYSVDYNAYGTAFEQFLNDGVLNSDLSGVDRNYISTTLIAKIESDNNVEQIDYGDAKGYEYEDGPLDPEAEYPIYDLKGYVIGYGTLAEHEESLEKYAAEPYYSIESIDAYKDFFIFKVWDKGLSEYSFIQADLNKDNQINAYRFLGVAGRN